MPLRWYVSIWRQHARWLRGRAATVSVWFARHTLQVRTSFYFMNWASAKKNQLQFIVSDLSITPDLKQVNRTWYVFMMIVFHCPIFPFELIKFSFHYVFHWPHSYHLISVWFWKVMAKRESINRNTKMVLPSRAVIIKRFVVAIETICDVWQLFPLCIYRHQHITSPNYVSTKCLDIIRTIWVDTMPCRCRLGLYLDIYFNTA